MNGSPSSYLLGASLISSTLAAAGWLGWAAVTAEAPPEAKKPAAPSYDPDHSRIFWLFTFRKVPIACTRSLYELYHAV